MAELRALIVDDSERDAALLVRELQKAGFSTMFWRVDTAEGMDHALDQREWDVILCDYVMPSFSGLKALELLRRKGIDLPFIIVSGQIGEDVAVEAMRAGAHDYIMKGNLKRLAPAVRREIEEARNRHERRKAEEDLKTTAERLNLVVNTIQDAFYIRMPAIDRIIYVSPAYTKMCGRKLLSSALSSQAYLEVVHPEDRDLVAAQLSDAGKTGRYTNEYRIVRPDGSVRWIRDRGFPVIRNGRVTAVAGILTDFTEQKQAEEERVAMHEDRLRAYQKLDYIGRLSGTIAHELRNPLATIDSSVVYLKARLTDADSQIITHLDRISHAVDQSVAAIQGLLEEARVKEPVLAPVDLRTLVDGAIRSCGIRPSVKVVKSFPADEVVVGADRRLLPVAFENIIRNALDAMGDGGTLTVIIQSDGKEARASFVDTGKGISPENLSRIFEPLFTTKPTGVGFGLSIARMIVGKHGGTIGAESEPGKGARFIIRLPLWRQ